MATPPANRCGGGESTAADRPRSVPTPFLTKTHQLVDDRSTNDVISWNEDGSAFIVWKFTEFARDLLPKYFKHSNFSSFVRQLNTYGFKKIMPDRWEFSHECFRRGEKKLLCDIQRRKMATPSSPAVPPTPVPSSKTVFPSDSGDEQVISSSNSPESVREFGGSKEELLGENDKLRKENAQLNKELSQMKSMCRNIYVLMSNYAGSCGEKNNGRSDSVVKSLDLLPIRSGKEMETAIVEAAVTRGDEECSLRSAAEEISARLFGVPIRTKRRRDGESGTAEQEMDLLQLQQPGGSEMVAQPLEQDVNGDDHQSSWLPRSESLNRMV